MNFGGWIHDAWHTTDDALKNRDLGKDVGYTAAALSGFPWGPLIEGLSARGAGNPSDLGVPGQPLGGGGTDDRFGLLASLMGGQQQQGGLYGGASGRSPSYLGGYGLI